MLAGKEFLGDSPGGAGVAGIVLVDGAEGLPGLLLGHELEQPLAGGIELAEAGLHGDHRPARGEVADAAVAEPAAVGADIDVLGDGAFAARAADEARIALHARRDRAR